MLHTMRGLAKLQESELGDVVNKLDAIRNKLFRKESVAVVVTCEESMIETLRELLAKFDEALPSGALNGHPVKPPPLDPIPEARTAPLPVAFNVRTFTTVRYQHPDAPVLLVLANYLRDTFLHRELREKGGAYGAYAQASTGGGTFYLGSYRDPNIIRTFDTFDRAVTWVTQGEIESETLKEAILGACGDVDPLESPDIKGRREAINKLTGFTRAEREKFKQRLLNVTAADLRRVTKSYLEGGRPVQATVAGPDLVEAARKERPGLFEVVAPV
jgi:Zn-dependent M16 (insulinase) family peptidase